MQTFLEKTEFLSEQKNTHMTHIEDKVIYGGVDGTRQAINALRELRNMLQGKTSGNLSLKWDGAPAIFAGIDPNDGKFFVAKKGIFNKTPKVYKTKADVDADTSGDLNTKMNAALEELPKLGIKGVIQGDFLFGPGDLKKKKIDGESYVTFHPNTIVYAVPARQAKDLLRARIGIVWHTTYIGDSFETMKASYGVNVGALKKSPRVWSQDAMLRDLSKATMDERYTKLVDEHLRQAGKLFRTVAGSTLRQLQAHPELPRLIEMFVNAEIKGAKVEVGYSLGGPEMGPNDVQRLMAWISQRYAKEIDKAKTMAGVKAKQKKMNEIMEFFSQKNIRGIQNLFRLRKALTDAKLILIKQLDTLSRIDTFVKTKRGYTVTGQEGYVAIDKLGGDAVKLVDRMEFSYNNFSPDIIKGWDKPSRN